MKLPGVPNFHQVSGSLYRSGQPTAKGMRELEKLGIKTIINLRAFHSDRDEIKEIKLRYMHIRMKAWHPEIEDVERFLSIVRDREYNPLILVHCMHGADRTGTMVAVYRIVEQGWSKERAVNEMVSGKYGFHKIFANLPHFIKHFDIKRFK